MTREEYRKVLKCKDKEHNRNSLENLKEAIISSLSRTRLDPIFKDIKLIDPAKIPQGLQTTTMSNSKPFQVTQIPIPTAKF